MGSLPSPDCFTNQQVFVVKASWWQLCQLSLRYSLSACGAVSVRDRGLLATPTWLDVDHCSASGVHEPCACQLVGVRTTTTQVGYRTWYPWASQALQDKYRWGPRLLHLAHFCPVDPNDSDITPAINIINSTAHRAVPSGVAGGKTGPVRCGIVCVTPRQLQPDDAMQPGPL